MKRNCIQYPAMQFDMIRCSIEWSSIVFLEESNAVNRIAVRDIIV